jgi:DNA-binding NarL/FixJ family response regulator
MPGPAELDVLIVDDHEAMRTLLRTVLRRAGVALLRDAASGAAGLALLDERRADLVLVDHSMPYMDGAAVPARNMQANPQTKVNMNTGHGEARYAEAARAAGADAVLVKPVAPRALLQAIERVLG